jgi:ABC-2 type transport system permease protein
VSARLAAAGVAASRGASGNPAPVADLLRHSALLTGRAVRSLLRQPAYAAITLVQPMIWLLLFGQLFKSVVHIPGFAAANGSYLAFITPGVVLMTALFSSGWAGTVFIEDMDRGVLDRLLASPVRRGAMIIGSLGYQGLTTVLQTLIVFGIAYAAGARFSGGAGGLVGIGVTLVAAVLLSMIIAAFSNAVALLVRQQEALIGISQFLVLPLQFLSSAIMDTRLAPAWVRHVARYNPVDWAVVASRQALRAGTEWGAVLPRLGLLVLLAAATAWLATRAFGSYQRTA